MASFDIGNVIIDQKIGEGAYGEVYQAHNSLSGQKYAIKTIKKSKLSRFLLKSLDNEIRIMKKLDHPNIIKTYYVDDNDETVSFYMELFSGNLQEYINEHKLTDHDVYLIFRQLASAIKYLHEEMHIVHRDIKLENVLFNNNSDMNIVLSDFGLSVERDPNGPLLASYPGSTGYAAPEVFRQIPYEGYPSDIYALGVCLFLMMTGIFPSQVRRYDEYIEDDDLLNLINGMLNPSEMSRFTIDDVINHRWLFSFEGNEGDENEGDEDDEEYEEEEE